MHSGRATSGGRRENELNSGSLPVIPGGLATLATIFSTRRVKMLSEKMLNVKLASDKFTIDGHAMYFDGV